MHVFQEKAQILWNKKVGHVYYKVGLKPQKGYSDVKPGQFVMLRLANQTTPFLRRPFSIHRLITTDEQPEGFELLYKVVGECTKRLSMSRSGDFVDILGPLGNGFLISDSYHHIFIVAGGIGVAPMPFLASSLQKRNSTTSECKVFLGGRSKDDLLCKDDFFSLKMRVYVATDDGSAGKKGSVADLLEMAIAKNRPDIICACGPFAMLRSVARISEIYAVPCQVSIETIMACGIGACLGCAVEGKEIPGKYLHACLDGPVFDASILFSKR